LSSASSKTAYGTAFCLAQRRGPAGAARVVGLTSTANRAFTQGLGCYDTVLDYSELNSLDPGVASVYIDFAGNAALRRSVHTHFGDALTFSSSIGGTHWEALGGSKDLPGPRPTLFFAPARIKVRAAPPPEGWGREVLEQRLADAWQAFIARVQQADDPWLLIAHRTGATASMAAYLALLDGQANVHEGLMLSMNS
ncbi:MAG: DUF2855 family protein, partial [Rubrivivax sp.]|nr:DUF2855 family protein [Rubrivivax sp.]